MRSATRRPVNYATLVSLDLLHGIVVHEGFFFIYLPLSLFLRVNFSLIDQPQAPKEGHEGPQKTMCMHGSGMMGRSMQDVIL